MSFIIPEQLEFRQELPRVVGNVDYSTFLNQMERIDELIRLGNLEKKVLRHNLKEAAKAKRAEAKKSHKRFKGLSEKERLRIQEISRLALRCGIARHLLGESYRDFTCRLADSPLLQRFCGLDRIDRIKVPSKSTLDRYEKMIPEKVIREIVEMLTLKVSKKKSSKKLGLKKAASMDDYYLDTTCVKANIHYPVDWILLRDATRTLMKAVIRIRKADLKNRMMEPQEFMSRMNKLCIQMSQTRRQKNSKAKRKEVLRLMKKLVKKIAHHALRHKELLIQYWEDTDLPEGKKNQLLNQIDGILDQLPEAQRQAHERIIGERQVPSKEKILSLYDSDIHPIVRGKSSEEVEFGNTLFLGEQEDGLIVDWMLYQDQASADSRLLSESLERMEKSYRGYLPDSVTGDRGFFSQKNTRYLEEKEIKNYICPRGKSPKRDDNEREEFSAKQKRRAQTEGRIGIVKNNFLGRPMRSKGFNHREMSVGWGILAHNLWVVARLPRVEEAQEILKKAA